MTCVISPTPPMNTEVYMSPTDESIEQEIQANGLTEADAAADLAGLPRPGSAQ